MAPKEQRLPEPAAIANKSAEAEMATKKKDEGSLAEAFAELESQASQSEKRPLVQTSPRHHGHDDDPWQEAQQRERKRRAFDNYDAKRSDIMFINNMRNRAGDPKLDDSDEEILKIMDKAMAMDEKVDAQSSPGDMLLIKNNEDQDSPKKFLGSKRSIGGIKQPSPHMLSEGTLIHAILLSEINTDLPGNHS